MKYEDFISGKLAPSTPTGIPGILLDGAHLFEFQRDLVQWALRRGRAAIFADTGLGKTRMQLTWAREIARATGKPVLILAPLAVAQQTVTEASVLGIRCAYVKDGVAVMHAQKIDVFVTNYDRLHLFEPSVFVGIVLDESSIIKHHTAKTFHALCAGCAGIPFRLCLTATPAPNDHTELGTTAEFLGICTRAEMLSEFFVHDGGETQVWRLKGHARRVFWQWVSTWGAMVRSPATLGYDASDYELPPLTYEHHIIPLDEDAVRAAGLLCAVPATTLMERRQARKDSIDARVAQCADLVLSDDEPWVVWCEYNAEQDALRERFGDECASVYGSLDADEKERRLVQFVTGEKRILLTKPSIAGQGLNLQRCARMAFVGVNDSFEQRYQCVRRIWRFGQKRPCVVHVFASEAERAVLDNLARKEREAEVMASELSREVSEVVRAEVLGSKRETNAYAPSVAMSVPSWCGGELPPQAVRSGLSANLVSLMLKDKADGFSNREIAKRHGVSPSTVSDYCSGKRRPV